uniref:Ig-like domain-containing protein n=1 Tax=Astyanax mexicanus TaxID=7994 RepID=A0A3B1JA15_ASTMX
LGTRGNFSKEKALAQQNYKNTINTNTGNRVTLSCRYTDSNVWLYWYRQYPSSKLDNLLYIYETGSVQGNPPPGFSAKVKDKAVHLEISSTAVSDSALYYCALQPTVTGNPGTLYKNL